MRWFVKWLWLVAVVGAVLTVGFTVTAVVVVIAMGGGW